MLVFDESVFFCNFQKSVFIFGFLTVCCDVLCGFLWFYLPWGSLSLWIWRLYLPSSLRFFSLLFIHFFFCLFLLLLIYWDNKSEKCPGMPQISEAASLSPISGNLNWFVSGYPNLLSPDSLDSVESFQWFPPPSISRLSFTFGTLLWLCLPFDVLWWRHAFLQLFA